MQILNVAAIDTNAWVIKTLKAHSWLLIEIFSKQTTRLRNFERLLANQWLTLARAISSPSTSPFILFKRWKNSIWRIFGLILLLFIGEDSVTDNRSRCKNNIKYCKNGRVSFSIGYGKNTTHPVRKTTLLTKRNLYSAILLNLDLYWLYGPLLLCLVFRVNIQNNFPITPVKGAAPLSGLIKDFTIL